MHAVIKKGWHFLLSTIEWKDGFFFVIIKTISLIHFIMHVMFIQVKFISLSHNPSCHISSISSQYCDERTNFKAWSINQLSIIQLCAERKRKFITNPCYHLQILCGTQRGFLFHRGLMMFLLKKSVWKCQNSFPWTVNDDFFYEDHTHCNNSIKASNWHGSFI